MTTTSDGEAAVLEKIVALPAFRDVAMRLHDLLELSAPHLEPRLWYGMPGYAASKRSPVTVFFRVDDDRYVTSGLTEKANLVRGDGPDQLIESAWFLTELDEAIEERIARIVSTAAA